MVKDKKGNAKVNRVEAPLDVGFGAGHAATSLLLVQGTEEGAMHAIGTPARDATIQGGGRPASDPGTETAQSSGHANPVHDGSNGEGAFAAVALVQQGDADVEPSSR